MIRGRDPIFVGTDNLGADVCGAPVRLIVPLREHGFGMTRGERTFRIRSITSVQKKDVDGLGFRCRPSTCGNYIIERDHESCDDGNRLAGDGCDRACQLE